MKILKNDLECALAEKTGFFKKNIGELIDAMGEVVVDYLKNASEDECVEVKLFEGLVIGAKYTPAHEIRDPRNGNKSIVEGHLLPYTRMTKTFRNKINNK